MRESGICIMKMINSTSSTSIIGTTLGSDLNDWASSGSFNDMSFPPAEQLAFLRLLRHRREHPHARLPGQTDRVFHLRVRQLLVGLEVEDLVRGTGRVGVAQRLLYLVLGDRFGVEVVLALLVNPEGDIAVLLFPFLDVLALR